MEDLFSGNLREYTDFIQRLNEAETLEMANVILNGENKIINEVAEERDKLYLQPESKSKPVPYYNIDFAGGWSSEELFTNVKPDFFINNPEKNRMVDKTLFISR